MKTRLKIFSAVFASLFLVLSSCATPAPTGPKTFSLTILHTSDTHGTPLAVSAPAAQLGARTYSFNDAGGLPARMAYVNKIRTERPNVLVLDSGDVMTGRVTSNYFQAEPDFMAMNFIGYDAMAIGNHEFDFALENLNRRKSEVKFPFLSANIVEKASRRPAFTPYVLLRRPSGITVAVFGLTTTETPTTTIPDNVANYDFLDPSEVAARLVPELKKMADLVICVSHLGLDRDRVLAQNVTGIDLILGGHTHSFMDKAEIVNGTPIFHSYQWGLFMGRVDIDVTDGKVTRLNASPVGINVSIEVKPGYTPVGEVVTIRDKQYDYLFGKITPDPGLAGELKRFNDQVAVIMAQKLGTVSSDMNEVTSSGLTRAQRRDDIPLTNFLNDAMRHEAARYSGRNVDVFLQNGGGIRAGIAAGDITKNTIYTVLPFDNTVQLVNLTGTQLKAVLEETALPIAIQNYTTQFDGPNGAFLQVSGMTFTLDIGNRRVTDITVGGEPLEAGKIYTIASNSFMMVGGDGYNILKNAREGFFETSQFQRDFVIAYLARVPSIDPALFDDDRIKIINTGR